MIKRIIQTFFSRRFFLFLVAGAIAAFIDWGAFVIQVYRYDIHYAYAVTISFILGATANFLMNKYLTFENHYKKVHYQFAVFAVIALTALGFTVLFMWFFIEKLAIEQSIARILAIGMTLVYNFFCHKYITFRIMK